MDSQIQVAQFKPSSEIIVLVKIKTYLGICYNCKKLRHLDSLHLLQGLAHKIIKNFRELTHCGKVG